MPRWVCGTGRTPPRPYGLDLPENNLREGAELQATVDIGNDDPVQYDLVVAWVDTVPWLRLQSVNRPYATRIAPGTGVEIALPGHALRWGRHHLGPVIAHAVAAEGLLVSPLGVAPGCGREGAPDHRAVRGQRRDAASRRHGRLPPVPPAR